MENIFEKIELLTEEEINNLNFYEALMYLELLNNLDSSYSELKENKNASS